MTKAKAWVRLFTAVAVLVLAFWLIGDLKIGAGVMLLFAGHMRFDHRESGQ